MKQTTTLAFSAIALSVAAAHVNAAEVTVYGKLNVAIQNVDDENEISDYWDVKSHASRFGIKGEHKLNDDLKAFYKLEWQVDASDKGGSDNIKSRNQIVGLKGGFGTVFLGRHDTPLKKAQKKVDLFGDLDGDIKNVMVGENRESNIVQYSSPKAGGVQLNAAFIPGETAGSEDGLADASSISVTWNNDSLYLAAARDTDVESQGVDSTRLVAQYSIGNLQLGGLYQDTDFDGSSEDALFFSAAYKMGKNKFKAQIGQSDQKAEGRDLISIGWDYKLSKKANTYVFYTTRNEDRIIDAITDEVIQIGAGKDVFGVGMVYKF